MTPTCSSGGLRMVTFPGGNVSGELFQASWPKSRQQKKIIFFLPRQGQLETRQGNGEKISRIGQGNTKGFCQQEKESARRLQEDKEKRKRSQENNENEKSLRISQGKRERLLPMRQENEKFFFLN